MTLTCPVNYTPGDNPQADGEWYAGCDQLTCPTCGYTPRPTPHAQRAYKQHRCARQLARTPRAQRLPDGPKRDCNHPLANHQHGTHIAYILDRCRCRPCRKALHEFNARAYRDRAYGRSNFTPADPVRRHVLMLMNAGLNVNAISAASGVGKETVRGLVWGAKRRKISTRIQKTSAERLLTVRPSAPRTSHARVDSTGTTRRLQALQYLGWSRRYLAAQLGISRGTITRIITTQEKVTSRVEAAVREVYDRLSMTVGPCARTRDTACRRRWVGPLAWDEYAIDDPTALPQVDGEPIVLGRQERRIENARWLLDQGEPLVTVAARVGVKETSLLQILPPELKQRIT